MFDSRLTDIVSRDHAGSSKSQEMPSYDMQHQSIHTSRYNSDTHNQRNSQNMYNESLSTQSSLPSSFPSSHPSLPFSFSEIIQLAIELLPILIRLFLTDKKTEIIECFVELGTKLKAGTIVMDSLKSMGITSLHTQ